MGDCRPNFKAKLTGEAPAPPPFNATITSVVADDGRMQINFDEPIDGSVLDPGWIGTLENAGATYDFFAQNSPTQIEVVPDMGATNAGDHWLILIAQTGIVFPQSGTID